MIYGIGLPRCGGQSLGKALATLLGECVHSPGRHPVNGPAAVEVFRDPLRILSEDPGARFILNSRDMQPWLESCQRVYHKASQWNHPLWLYPLRDFEAYRREYILRRICAIEDESRLLIWDVTKRPEWEPLCEFLSVPVPDVPFPNLDKVGR